MSAPDPAQINDPVDVAAQRLDSPGIDLVRLEESVREILVAVGEDPTREGLEGTPARVARAYSELLAGYRTDPHALINGALFREPGAELVVVRDIPFYSLCEHHMLPFFGRAQVGYLPREKVIGLSKIPRIVDLFAQRLQIQERLTRQIADFLSVAVEPAGVGVVIEATHLCACMRGVRKPDASMRSQAMRGVFAEDPLQRQELLALLA